MNEKITKCRILHNSCPKIYQNILIFYICRKTNKMKKIPEFYAIFARKMPGFYLIIGRKIFSEFYGGMSPLPPSPTSTLQMKVWWNYRTASTVVMERTSSNFLIASYQLTQTSASSDAGRIRHSYIPVPWTVSRQYIHVSNTAVNTSSFSNDTMRFTSFFVCDGDRNKSAI